MTSQQACNFFADLVNAHGEDNAVKLGLYASYTWRHDAKHHFFTLARYKFCSKMLAGKEYVLDVGCGDGVGEPLLLQSIGKIHAVDINPVVIAYNRKHNSYSGRIIYEARNIIETPLEIRYDAAISLDVLEHICHENEDTLCVA